MDCTDKHLYGINDEKVLFFFRCYKCQKNRAFFDNSEEFQAVYKCSKCSDIAQATHSRKGNKITTKYDCSHCGFTEISVLDLDKKPKEIEEIVPGGVPSPRIEYRSKKAAFKVSRRNFSVSGRNRWNAALERESNPRTRTFSASLFSVLLLSAEAVCSGRIPGNALEYSYFGSFESLHFTENVSPGTSCPSFSFILSRADISKSD